MTLICLLLAGTTLACFWPAFHHDFINFDDQVYITQNLQVQKGLTWNTASWAFKTFREGNWHPITWLSHALDCQLFGLNPGAHHLVSVIFHSVNTVLLFLVLRRLTTAIPTSPLPSPPAERGKEQRVSARTASSPVPSPPEERGKTGLLASATWRSAFVAALFGLHPMHVESVAWAAERKDVLSAFFFFLTIWAYVEYAKSKVQVAQPAVRCSMFDVRCSMFVWYSLALFLFACGLMSKPMLVTLPFLLLLLDFWPLRRFQPATCNLQLSTLFRLFVEKLPFFALSAASSIVTFLAQRQSDYVASVITAPVRARLSNAIISYAAYLKKLVWPTDLAVYYPYRHYLPLETVVASGLVLIAISFLAFVSRRKRPYLAFGWLWFLGMLVPVIGLVQVGLQAMADRYSYLPYIGLFICIAWGANDVACRWRLHKPALVVAAVLVLVGCFTVTAKQVRVWKNSEVLFRHTLAVTGDNPLIEGNLGSALVQAGRNEEAIEYLSGAVRKMPAYIEPELSWGIALIAQGKVEDAVTHFRNAAATNPRSERSHYFLANALLSRGERTEAIAEYEIALQLNPEFVLTLNDLAWLLATDPDPNRRNGARAVVLAERACALIHNQDPLLIGTLAAAYAEAGRFPEAIEAARKAENTALGLGDKDLATRNRGLLELYLAGKPYHEAAPEQKNLER